MIDPLDQLVCEYSSQSRPVAETPLKKLARVQAAHFNELVTFYDIPKELAAQIVAHTSLNDYLLLVPQEEEAPRRFLHSRIEQF